MICRTLDAYKKIPKRLRQHLGEQLCIEPPDLGMLRALYDDRTDTLADHQKLACQGESNFSGFGNLKFPTMFRPRFPRYARRAD
ncbi:hypothetical protein WT60_19330 [Burkholderia sp. MSMB617WGS]|nr:hypothetical protein WT60_19330 [Burkholderia sp. MSMB617WGS]